MSTARSTEAPVGRASATGGGLSGRMLAVLLGAALVAAVGAVASVQWCRINGWADPGQHIHMCYSDFSLLFTERGLADGRFPFVDPVPEDQIMEYPVLIAVVAGLTAMLVPGTGHGPERTLMFFDINMLLVIACWFAVVVVTALSAGRRRSDALMVALAPGIVLTISVNWDMWAVFLGGFALLLWGRSRPMWAGVLIGLGTAMKLYPLFFLGAILVLCVRTGRIRSAVTVAVAAAATWLAVNVPFMVTAFEQWSRFYVFSSEREVSFSSMWLAFQWTGLDGSDFSTLQNGLFLLCCLAIAWLGWAAPTRPRTAQLCFLIVASFILLGKVYSPQFVMWLIPLLVLARPRVGAFVVWQAAEVLHWASVWLMSAKITSGGEFGAGHLGVEIFYGTGIVLHMATLIWLMVLVVREILRPERDVVRAPVPGADYDPAYDPLAGITAARDDRFLVPGLGLRASTTLRW